MDFRRSRPAETLMGAKVGIVRECEFDLALDIERNDETSQW